MISQPPTSRISRTFAITAILGLTIAGAVAPISAQAAGKVHPKAHRAGLVTSQEYVIVSLTPGTPNSIQVRDLSTSGSPITVTLSPNATVVRRYNGKSSFAELSVNDRITVAPAKALGLAAAPAATTPLSTTAALSTAPVMATRIKDFSIQVAYTQIAGKITTISADKSQLTVQVSATKGHNVSAFQVGQSVTLDVSATTPVFLGKKAGTVADLQAGMVLRTWGLSDGTTGILAAPHAIHVVPQKAAASTDAATTTSDGTPA